MSICISFRLVVFHCTSLSIRVKLESDKMMRRTLKCVFPLGWKKLIGVWGASTCTLLRNFFPHFVDKELTFMQQLWSKCHTECSETSSSVTEALWPHNSAQPRCKIAKGRKYWILCPFRVAGELKEKAVTAAGNKPEHLHVESTRKALGTWKSPNILSQNWCLN